MNKKNLMILVAVMVLAAIGGTSVAMRAGKTTPVDLTDPEQFRDGGQDSTVTTVSTVDLTMKSAKVDLDELWERTLFNPDRHEIAEMDGSGNAAEEQMNADFELAGIAELGLPGSKAPVAIIRARQKTAANRNNGRTVANARSNVQNQRQQQNRQAANAKNKAEAKEKTVFRQGEVVGKTGYTLTGIYPQEKMVELTRGRDTIRLYIEYKSEQSAERRKNAANQEAAHRQARTEDVSVAARNNTSNANKPAPAVDNGGAKPVPADNGRRVQPTQNDRGNSQDNVKSEEPAPVHFDNNDPNTPPPPPNNPRRSARRNAM